MERRSFIGLMGGLFAAASKAFGLSGGTTYRFNVGRNRELVAPTPAEPYPYFTKVGFCNGVVVGQKSVELTTFEINDPGVWRLSLLIDFNQLIAAECWIERHCDGGVFNFFSPASDLILHSSQPSKYSLKCRSCYGAGCAVHYSSLCGCKLHVYTSSSGEGL